MYHCAVGYKYTQLVYHCAVSYKYTYTHLVYHCAVSYKYTQLVYHFSVGYIYSKFYIKCDFSTTILMIYVFLVVLSFSPVELTDVSEDRAASFFRVVKQTLWRFVQKSPTPLFQFLFNFFSFLFISVLISIFIFTYLVPPLLQNSRSPHNPQVQTLTVSTKPTSHANRLLS